MTLEQREMESTHTEADQRQRLAIRPHREQAIAYLIGALVSLFPCAFGMSGFIFYAAVHAIVAICSFIPAVTLNRKDGMARKYHLIRLPIKRPLSDFKVVTISRADKQGVCYQVGLECPAKPLVVIETKDYVKAREYAESVATFLELNIRDEALGRTTFHRRRNVEPTSELDHSAQEDWDKEPNLDRTAILSSLDSNEVLEVRRDIGFEVYLGTAWLSLMAGSGLLFLPPMQGAGWMTQAMQGFFAFLLVVSFSSFLSHRGGIILVRDSPYLFTWKRLRLRPLMKIRPIREFDRVTLSYEKRLSEKGKHAEFHCIRLDGESVPVTILETKDDTRAAELTAQVAEFLSLPIDDFMERDGNKATLRTRIIATDADWNLAPPPAGIAVEYERRGDEFVFKVPAHGFGHWKLPLLVGIFLPVITIGLLTLVETGIWQPPPPRRLQTTLWTACIASCVLYLPLLLALILPFMRTLSRREQIHVSPNAIRVRSRALDTKTDLTLPVGELLDVAIGCPTSKHLVGDMGGIFAPGKVIRACGTVHTLEFGGNLTRDERSWLRKAVIAILLADQTPDEREEQAATHQSGI